MFLPNKNIGPLHIDLQSKFRSSAGTQVSIGRQFVRFKKILNFFKYGIVHKSCQPKWEGRSRPPLPPLSAIVRISPTPLPTLSAIVSISPTPPPPFVSPDSYFC